MNPLAPARPRYRLAPGVPSELGRAWSAECWRWFGPGRTPLPRAPDNENLALIETPLGPVVAKREVPVGWKRSLVTLHARPLRSPRALALAGELLARGLATPAPLAVLVRRERGVREAVLVTRYVEGFGSWEYLRRGGDPARLVEALARALARLHAAGFRHRDLKESNVLLGDSATGLEVLWTDLDGLRARGAVRRPEGIRDLARLGMSFESAEARAAGVRADAWPALVRTYLRQALEREPARDELELYLLRTRRWAERSICRHLAQGRPVL